MPAKEIKEFRKSGKLNEAYEMAKSELSSAPDDIWAKRNLSWVLVDFIKAGIDSSDHDVIKSKLSEIAGLNMPAEEVMLFENVCWVIGKYLFSLIKNVDWATLPFPEKNKIIGYASTLLPLLGSMQLPLNTEGYSFLYKAFHKILKDSGNYIQFVDWWNLDNFRDEDYNKDTLPNGKEIMSLAEQAYICYAKHLLPRQTQDGLVFDKEKTLQFIDRLDKIIDSHPQYTYTEFYKAKLLLALGDNDNILSSLLPFARRKRNEFWVWDILADVFSNDMGIKIACYCKALTCKTPPEFLVNVHQKLAAHLIGSSLYNEAKTEIEAVIKIRNQHSWNLPHEIRIWTEQQWFANANANQSNILYYKMHLHQAESLLYSDTPEEKVFIEFVNKDKKLANFIASESKFGFFKFERFTDSLQPGDIVTVRFNGNGDEGYYRINTLNKVQDEEFLSQFYKEVNGTIRIPAGKNIGFVDNTFVPPSLITQYKLKQGDIVIGKGMKSFNKEKGTWGWKMIEMN